MLSLSDLSSSTTYLSLILHSILHLNYIRFVIIITTIDPTRLNWTKLDPTILNWTLSVLNWTVSVNCALYIVQWLYLGTGSGSFFNKKWTELGFISKEIKPFFNNVRTAFPTVIIRWGRAFIYVTHLMFWSWSKPYRTSFCCISLEVRSCPSNTLLISCFPDGAK